MTVSESGKGLILCKIALSGEKMACLPGLKDRVSVILNTENSD
jgi:hypothetical protein